MPAFEELDDQEARVLTLASVGSTVVRVAQLLSLEVGEVETARHFIIKKFEVPNMAAAVNTAIQSGILDIEPKYNPRLEIRDVERTILERIAAGESNNYIARALGKSSTTLLNNSRGVFRKLGASGRTHSVRRSYEFGILSISGSNSSSESSIRSAA